MADEPVVKTFNWTRSKVAVGSPSSLIAVFVGGNFLAVSFTHQSSYLLHAHQETMNLEANIPPAMVFLRRGRL